jgi:LuxR family maltose regulon positive regulatory protein
MSVREISSHLYVSVNTVKTHQRALYRKLDVTTRNEALDRAKDFGLL